MRQESFIFYTSWLDAIKPYDEELQNQIIRMIIDYAAYGVEPDLSGFSAEAHTVYTLVKPLIDANSKRRKGAPLGGRPSKEKTTKETIGFENKKPMDIEKENHRFLEKETIGFENKKPNVNDNDNVNVNVNDKEKANAKKKEDVATSSRARKKEKTPYVNPLDNEVIDSNDDVFIELRQWQKQFTPETMKMRYTNFITERDFWNLVVKINPSRDDIETATDKIKNTLLQIENRSDLRKRYTNLYLTTLNWLKRDGEIKDEKASIEKIAKNIK